MTESFYNNLFLNSTGINTDTRTLKSKNIFIALKGDNFNGNIYVEKALENGALHAVSDDDKYNSHKNVTIVKDCLLFLQELATYHRKILKTPIVALTGSNGKTTTKEIIISILKTQYNVTGTQGNLNNHIGVPLTLLSFTKETEIGVVEMGANHMKEIEALAAITLPDYGLITNYGKAHLEGFGSEENIKIGKSELYENLRTNNKTAIVGSWDQDQINRSSGINRILSTTEAQLIETEPFVKLKYKNTLCNTQLTGAYNYQNILLAATVGEAFNITTDNIIKGIEDYLPTNNRSQIIIKQNLKIILDAYNANPNSMEAALRNLALQSDQPKTAILGDMFELGPYASDEHLKIASLAIQLGIDSIHLIGENFYNISIENVNRYKDFSSFKDQRDEIKNLKGILLLKGSRGMALERVLELF